MAKLWSKSGPQGDVVLSTRTRLARNYEGWNFAPTMKENDAYHCVEKRPAKMAVEEIHNESGEVPAGLRFEQTIEFQFRKA